MPKLEADNPMSGKKYNLLNPGDWLDLVGGVFMFSIAVGLGLKVVSMFSSKTGIQGGGNILGFPSAPVQPGPTYQYWGGAA